MPRKRQIEPGTVEAETQRIGRYLWDHLSRRTPSIFERRWWDDRILSWAMADESVKVQMFRFVDVLPRLTNHEAIARHLQEYFEEVDKHLPGAVRLVLEYSQPNSVLGRALALNARGNARRMAERFIAGSTVEEVLQTIGRLRRQGFAFTLDLLGEAVLSEAEAQAYQQAYLDLIEGLASKVNTWPEIVATDCDHRGPIPRVNVSLKLSALDSQFRPLDAAATSDRVKSRLRPILRAAREHGAYVHVDMEQYAYKALSLEIFKSLLTEDEFRDFADVGVVVQTYVPDAERDLADLLSWVRRRGTPVTVRLVKGAYWDYETVVARSRGWPVPVYHHKWQTDDNFERQTRFLLENCEWLRPAFASHNLRSLAHAIAWAKAFGLSESAYEIQMLYGMGMEQAQLLADLGHRVRIYTPFGQLIPGMAYLVRRLLENTSNDSFLRHSFARDVAVEELLMNPDDLGAQTPPVPEEEQLGFQNEPHTDFSRAEARDAMEQAIEAVKSRFGEEYPLVIDGRAVHSKNTLVSRNPSRVSQVVGRVAAASPDDAEAAVAAARKAFPDWSQVEPGYRAEYLELAAREMRNLRFELAAWETLECAKPWDEADADVAEAIDFCLYYADQMRRLAAPQHRHIPGEENDYLYRARGVSLVIAPWNFPLAILTGMTAAALVSGNTVVMKPSGQSSVVAAQLMRIFQSIGLPNGVLNYLPGIGREIGQKLVSHPDVDLVAFTGSREVGLSINRTAAAADGHQKSVKRVIAEMGGKNAIIVDDDADLDEAVAGVLQSAFGYSGQKCSACSRVIVLKAVYDLFLDRLIKATESLAVGPPESPSTTVGPVIDAEARERIQQYIAIGEEECTLAFAADVSALNEDGYYIGPHIFTDVDPTSRLAQEEIFGPVLCVIKANDLDEAFAIANDTDYALTGGIYSRSPANLKRARQEFHVGNLYLNRGITGALVDRQPFGGFKLSGIGSKAGGPDYLLQFLIPVSITENTLRRGFAPNQPA